MSQEQVSDEIASSSLPDINRLEHEVKQAFTHDRIASEVVQALLHCSAYSSRASETTESIAKLSNTCLTSWGEVDVLFFRQIVSSSFQIKNEIWIRLLHAALFGNNSNMVLKLSEESFRNNEQQTFSQVDRNGREHWHFDVNINNNVREISVVKRRIFHGSAIENWLSILHTGLKCSRLAVNGRMFGDGVYLAKNFATAASFAPMTRISEKSNGSIKGMCIVGEFELSEDENELEQKENKGLWDADIPDEYLVVRDANKLKLVCLHVLGTVSDGREKRTTRRNEEMQWKGLFGDSIGNALNGVNAFWLILLAYVLWLVWIGQST